MAGPFAGMARIFLAIHGTDATLSREGEADRQVRLIFRPRGEAAEIPISGGAYALPVTTQQTLAFTDPDTDVQKKDRLTIGGEAWRVREIEFDGGALNRLQLVK